MLVMGTSSRGPFICIICGKMHCIHLWFAWYRNNYHININNNNNDQMFQLLCCYKPLTNCKASQWLSNCLAFQWPSRGRHRKSISMKASWWLPMVTRTLFDSRTPMFWRFPWHAAPFLSNVPLGLCKVKGQNQVLELRQKILFHFTTIHPFC